METPEKKNQENETQVTQSGPMQAPVAKPQQPSVGRIVMYVTIKDTEKRNMNNGADVAPALIVRVWDNGVVNLKVFFDGDANQWMTSVPYNEEKVDRSWHWPPRV